MCWIAGFTGTKSTVLILIGRPEKSGNTKDMFPLRSGRG